MKAVTHNMSTLYCPHCGNERVEALGWVQVNTGEVTDDFLVPKYRCPGCGEMITDEDEEDEYDHFITLQDISEAIDKFIWACPNNFSNLATGDYDMIDADNFFQFLIFGEIVYG